MICPTCQGKKQLQAFVDGRDSNGKRWGRVQLMDCFRCNGRGEVADGIKNWIEDGEKLRDFRIKSDRSQREEAKRRGMSVALLSQMEAGLTCPVFPDDYAGT